MSSSRKCGHSEIQASKNRVFEHALWYSMQYALDVVCVMYMHIIRDTWHRLVFR